MSVVAFLAVFLAPDTAMSQQLKNAINKTDLKETNTRQIPGTLISLGANASSRLAAPNGPTLNNTQAGALTEAYSSTGHYTLSVDGKGSSLSSMTVRVNKPNAAATVQKVILMSTATGSTIANGCVTLSGLPVNWNGTATSSSSGIGFYNYWADVTSLVSTQINALPAGISTLTVTECNSAAIEGSVLLVVFNDATATEKTIIIMFGAATPAGDNFSVTLAQPIDPAQPGALLDMGLGIGFSYQAAGGTQTSQVSVNGQRLSSSAGGEDDGASENGALLTVGGIGNVNTNPLNPNAGPTNQFTDDELYTILPFITNTTTSLNINTVNPSGDDNIFLAYFALSGAAIIGEGILLTQTTTSGNVGTNHTVKAVVKNANGQPLPNKTVTFTITAGPNFGLAPFTATTDANGEVNFTYLGSGGPGVDTIMACFTDSQNQLACSNVLSFQWLAAAVPPTIECPADIIVNATTGLCGANVTYSAAIAAGDPTPNVTYSHASGSFFPVGSTVVTATATNVNGSSTCEFVVSVLDTIAPVLSISNIERCFNEDDLGCAIALGVTASDNCEVESLTNNAPQCFPVGNTTVTWTATDVHGNVTIASQVVTRHPEIVVTCPGNRTVACNENAAEAFAAWIAGFSYTGGDANTTVTNLAQYQMPAPGVPLTIAYSAENGCGSDSCTSVFTTVADTISPVFTFCPQGVDLGCNPQGGVPAPAAATATDNNGTPSITSSLGQESVDGCLHTQIRTYTATDACGNSATCLQVFTWTVDTTPPVFTLCPSGANLGCNPTGIPAPEVATATDACGVPSITSALGEESSVGCMYSQTRTYTATDACGNSSTCTQEFTWRIDLEGPVFSGISENRDVLVNDEGDTCAQDLGGGGIATVTEKMDNSKQIAKSRVNFDQPRNEDHPNTPLSWTYGVNNFDQAEYFEGMGVPQRIVFTQLTGSTHTFKFRHEAVKHQGGVSRHAYDFLMSWEQAVATAGDLGNGAVNELQNLTAQQCDGIASCPNLTNSAFASLADTMGNPPNHHGNRNVDAAVATFEQQYGNRQIEIKGDAPISDFNIAFDGYSGTATGDNYAWYTVTWTSASSNVMIKLAGRAAQGAGSNGYGNCYGAGSIDGAPYHFRLEQLDGASLGSRDNQVMVEKTCDVNIPVEFDTPIVTDNCSSSQIDPVVVGADVVTQNADGSKTHCRTWEATDTCGKSSTYTQCITVSCSNETVAFKKSDVIEMSGASLGDKLKVKAYPNPYTSDFNLSLSTTVEGNVSVLIYDMTGRLLERNDINPSEISEVKIGNKYTSGVYNVVVTQGSETKTLHVIKR
ncbi:HYR domain-containing protein [Flavobacterium phycosphaerae]|uniref:HYR domain-containing protein n=1 Tax=Flavobacterium phycosphaerae TaxID=2697515 RepID=UPI00138AEB27|nr:HYR domain-containing protein [Flavobacterium phycosphaerae]